MLKPISIKIDIITKQIVTNYSNIRKGDTLQLSISIYQNSASLDISSQTIRLILRKSDGYSVEKTITGIGNVAITSLDEQATVAIGEVTGEIQFSDSDGVSISNWFTYQVNETLSDDVVIKSKDSFETLEQIEKALDASIINEVVTARGTYDKLDDRLDDYDSKIIKFDNLDMANIKDYGAKGDGITNDYAAFSSIVTEIGIISADIYIPTGIYIIGASITIPSNINLIFAKGAILSPASGVAITINGSIDARLYQIFAGSGTIEGTPKISCIYPEWFGAVVGIDSTSAINKAIVFAGQSGGGMVALQDGTYITSSVIDIKYSNVVLCGIGNGTIISCNFATGNVFYAGRASLEETAVENVEFRNLKIISTVTRTSDAVFYCQYAERFTFDNIWVAKTGSNMYNGIFLDKFDDVLLSRILIYNCTNTGIRLNGLSDQTWGANAFLNNGSKIYNCNYGVHVAGAVGGLSIEDCDIIGNAMNIVLDATVATVRNREIFINQCFIDSAGNMGLHIGDNGVAYLHITGTWIASSGLTSNGGGTDGNGINTTGNQYSDMNVIVSGCRIYNCFGSGAVINSGRWTFTGCNIHTNGRGVSGGYGIYTPNTNPKISITGCQITDNGNSTLGVGIQTINGLSNYIIANNVVLNNVTAQIVDDSSSTSKVVANNLTA